MHEIIKILREDKSYNPTDYRFENPNYHPDTIAYKQWWKEEIKRCVEGYWHEGRYAPPQLYTYINDGVIERLDDSNITSQKTAQPLLRDIEWLFFYNWLICRKFSGFSLDENYTCNKLILDPKFKREKATKYVLKSNGTFKEYIDPREYLYKKHDRNLGLPIYENNALNLILLTARGCGKLLEPDAKIRKKDGWTTMRDVRIGDKVYGSDGKLCNVIAKTPLQVNVKMYEITLRNNKKIKACKDHLWKVRNHVLNKIEIVNTEYLYNNYKYIQKNMFNSLNENREDSIYSIEVNKPLNEESNHDIKLHPYIIGVIMTCNTKISYYFEINGLRNLDVVDKVNQLLPKDYELVTYKEDYSYIFKHKKHNRNRFYVDYPEASAVGREKRIPNKYLYNTEEIRLEVLKGMVDVLGRYEKNKTYTRIFEEHKKNMVEELAGSLGINYKTYFKKYPIDINTYKGTKSELYITNLYTDLNLFTVSKYRDRVLKNRTRLQNKKLYNFIDNIQPAGKSEGYCISVDSVDNTYITNDFIVTHNSYWGMACSIHEFIFNSNINYEQLIDEIKSKHKTKVNCILTCELEDKAVDLINKVKTWYENMPGSFGEDDDYVPSPLYRAYTGSWANKITQQVEKYYYTKDGTKAKRFDGSGSTLGVVTFNKDPYKTAGKRNSVTIIEEIGLCTNLLTFWNANKDVQRIGRTKFGSTLGIGTGGDMEKVLSAKRIFENPSIYDCLEFEDTFENSGKKIGLFVPAHLGNNDFKDKKGLTDLEEGFSYHESERQRLLLNYASSRDIDDEIMNRPLYPSEMFLSKKGNIFPTTELKHCLFELIKDEKRLQAGNKGILVRCADCKNGVKFENDIEGNYAYIDSYPIPKEYKKDERYLRSCIRIWEHPSENAPKGLYKIGYDTVHYDHVENPESLISILVYKGNTRFLSNNEGDEYYDMIVAEYTGRFDLLDKNNEVVEMLSRYYNNAEIMMEVNIAINIEYFKRRGIIHLLSTQPSELLDKHIKNRTQNSIVGYIKSPELVPFLEQSVKEWLQKERGMTAEGKIIKTMNMINSKPLLEELIAYNRDDNFDRINALFGIILSYKQDNLDIEDNIYNNENMFMKSIRNKLDYIKKGTNKVRYEY